jgi:hypothetical protein
MVTPNVRPWVTGDDIEAQLQDEFTNRPPRAFSEPQRIDSNDSMDIHGDGKPRWALIRLFLIRISGKSHGDTSAELWLMYLGKRQGNWKINEGWKGDRDDVLVFVSSGILCSFHYRPKRLVQTGLFSATVAIFLMESYKLLSPDLNNAITVSLAQIAQQLVSISNGAPFQDVIVQSNAPSKHAAFAIRINVMWLLSLVLSLTYALSAALPYWGFAQHDRAPHKYAHILRGTESISRVVDSTPTLLHLSIFLFIAGLIDLLLLMNKTVAFCVLGYVSAFSFACLVFTTFPCRHLDDPRRTPLPRFAWRIFLIIVLAILVVVVEIEGLLHGFFSSIRNRGVSACVPEHPPAFAAWRDALEGRILEQRRSPADGLQQSIYPSTTTVQLVDASPLCKTVSALDQDLEI